MKPQEVAKRLSVIEFSTICSWLDEKYGTDARTFEVMGVLRSTDRQTLLSVEVILENGNRVTLKPDFVKRSKLSRRIRINDAA